MYTKQNLIFWLNIDVYLAATRNIKFFDSIILSITCKKVKCNLMKGGEKCVFLSPGRKAGPMPVQEKTDLMKWSEDCKCKLYIH